MSIRKLRLGRDHLVVKSNALVPILSSLSLNELRFLAFCMSKLPRELGAFPHVTARATELADIYEISTDSVYYLVESLTIKINSKPLKLETATTRTILFWFSSVSYILGEATFTFKFNDELKPHLLQLRDNFTSYRIRDVYQFKAASSWHIYEVLRQYKAIGIRKFELDEFKALIGVQGKYSRFSNFKQKILDPAIEDINALSDLYVEYEIERRGLIASRINFFLRDNTSTLTAEDRTRNFISRIKRPVKYPELARLLATEYGVSTQNARKLCFLVEDTRSKTRVLALLPTLRERYARLSDPRSSLGAYVYATLRDELSRPYLAPPA